MPNIEKKLDELRGKYNQIDPSVVSAELAIDGTVLIDVREKEELESGMVKGAIHIPKSMLELQIEDAVENKQANVLLICGSGVRSLLAAESMEQLGYQNLRSVAGGIQAWKDQGLSVVRPKILDSQSRQRYARHLLIPEIGEEGQLKLLNSKVLLVGAGGLGSPSALYLAAAGIGTIGIIDNDVVEISNLQRQVIHGESTVGQKKVESAAVRLKDINAGVNVITYDSMLDETNVDEIIAKYDVVVDGSDNFNTRYLINDACVKHKIPNVHGAVYRFEGYVTVFDKKSGGPCYRCLYPTPPPAALAPSCMEAGVLGVLPGVIGLLQAVEAIKIILGIGMPINNKLLRYDALESEFSELDIEPDRDCQVCGENADPITFKNYQAACVNSNT